jgi:RHS repeat-associated protein
MPMQARVPTFGAWRDRQPVRLTTSGAKNRPLSVTVNNKRTCYVYGAGGTRLKKVENLAANANCAVLPATAVSTVYFGAVEVRNWLVPGQEQVLTYPSPAVKLTNGVASYLHRDHLGSVRAITDASGARVESAVYKPFGEQTEFVTPGLAAPESKGWIGERYDADAGLQYLNARYYDPVLGIFLQPDWFEVLKPGVGTNRFSYSFNDPVNKLDPLGNYTEKEIADQERTIANYAAGEHRDTLKGIDDEIDDIRGRDGIDDEDLDRLSFLNEHRRRVADQLEAWEAIAAMTDDELVELHVANSSSIFAQVMLGLTGTRSGTATAGSIRGVNPRGHTNNCVNCAIATDRTLAGFPTSAMPQSGRGAPVSVLTDIFGGRFRQVSGQAEITRIMEAAGPGSRGIVMGQRAGSEVGHVFNVTNQNGTVRFLDGQSGTTATFSNGYVAFGLLRTN